jgi:anti-sigma B factor antagonist
MRVGVEQQSPWTVLRLEGDLDAEAGPGVYLLFQRRLLHGDTQFLFNLHGVDAVDSAGLGVLVRCYRDARSRGGQIRLADVPDTIERILSFTRLDALLQVDREAA